MITPRIRQCTRWFDVGVLGDKFALDGELEDGVAEVGEGFEGVVAKNFVANFFKF